MPQRPFFVDKDVDDIVAKVWPTDPRIFVTDVYSIENYLVNEGAAGRYFADFVKLKKVTFDLQPALAQFDRTLAEFQRMIRPVMAWIVVMRRAGALIRLTDIKLSELFRYSGGRLIRTQDNQMLQYLIRVTGAPPLGPCWKQVRRVCRELDRQGEPKRYTRGKFEAWFLIQFVRNLMLELRAVAEENRDLVKGSISATVDLHEANFVQLLVRGVEIPSSIGAFLNFHLAPQPQSVTTNPETRGFLSRIRSAVSALFREPPRAGG